MSLNELASNLGGFVHGPGDISVKGIGIPSESDEKTVCVIWSKKESENLPDNALVISNEAFFSTSTIRGIEVKDPRRALVQLLSLAEDKPERKQGVHSSAVISDTAMVDPEAFIGPACVIGDNAVISAGAVLEAQVYVGRDVHIGKNSFLEPGVVVYDRTMVGENTLIHANSVIAIDGFGFIPSRNGEEPVKIPQLGRVLIGDNVEIGACCTVDRGTLGDTIIRNGVKTDDHVHIAHNADIGKGCLLVAQVGIAGSSILEDSVVMAARSGTADHVKIGKGAQVAAMGGAIKDVPAGAVVSGFPARDHKQNYRILALIQKLPELFKKVKRLEKLLSTRTDERE